MARAQSNTYPSIQRLQGAILYPCNVTESQDEQGTTIYDYDEFVIPDVGQQVTDADLFVQQNWQMLRATALGDFRAAPPAVQWEVYKAQIEAMFPEVTNV